MSCYVALPHTIKKVFASSIYIEFCADIYLVHFSL